jgi:hypothetical protein
MHKSQNVILWKCFDCIIDSMVYVRFQTFTEKQTAEPQRFHYSRFEFQSVTCVRCCRVRKHRIKNK